MSPADAAAAQLCRVAAEAHAAVAEMTRLAADFDDAGHWQGDGIRSCSHWLTINTGVNAYTADEVLRVGHALRDLPRLRAAFEAGQLSLDKMRTVSRVATAVDEDIWVELALHASGTQLVRICQGFTRAAGAETPDAANDALARRGVWAYWRDDGLIDVRALLPAEDGAIVLAAIEAAKVRLAERSTKPADARLDPALDTAGARRADALVALCEESSTRACAESDSTAPPARLVVHVDVGVLTGDDPQGRCHVDDGPSLSASVARRLGCDAEVVAITERDGLPIDVGRSRRTVSGRLRRALEIRDRGCRFPGCGIPNRHTHGHHIRHWAQGGRTDLGNVISLCGFHHRRLHDGAYSITVTDDGVPHFVDRFGRDIGPPDGQSLDPRLMRRRRLVRRTLRGITPDTPVARDHGAHFDLHYAVAVVSDNCAARKLQSLGTPAAGP
jgi:hypothetical protein